MMGFAEVPEFHTIGGGGVGFSSGMVVTTCRVSARAAARGPSVQAVAHTCPMGRDKLSELCAVALQRVRRARIAAALGQGS